MNKATSKAPKILIKLRNHKAINKAPKIQIIGDSNNTVRGYRLDIPRFEESLKLKTTQHVRGARYLIRRMDRPYP